MIKDLKEFFFCNEFEDWEVLFLEYLNGNIDLSFLEEQLESDKNLENQIGKDNFIELMSLGFRDKYSTIEVSCFVKRNIISEDKFQKWKVCDFIKKSGRMPRFGEFKSESNKMGLPELFLKAYGGLLIGEDQFGKKIANTDIYFSKEPDKYKEIRPWERLLGELTLIGSAADDFIFLYMSIEGAIYKYLVVTKEVYRLGKFKDAMIYLLLGVKPPDYKKIVVM